jgi:hypothetical protein
LVSVSVSVLVLVFGFGFGFGFVFGFGFGEGFPIVSLSGIITESQPNAYCVQWRDGLATDASFDEQLSFDSALPTARDVARFPKILFFRMLIEAQTYAEVFYQESYGGCTSTVNMQLLFAGFKK